MLRLNMAVPPTSRQDANFSSLGLIQAAVLGLTTPPYSQNPLLEFIPNMDGFPNGRRLEDDVTRIELQAVSGAVLAAIGLWYDDYTAGDPNPVTPRLGIVLGYSTGVESNDVPFSSTFPYVAAPKSGTSECGGALVSGTNDGFQGSPLGYSQLPAVMKNYPNPFTSQTTFKIQVNQTTDITIRIFDLQGREVANVCLGYRQQGEYVEQWNASGLAPGMYFANLYDGSGRLLQTSKLVKQ